jgi:hypothetical protein
MTVFLTTVMAVVHLATSLIISLKLVDIDRVTLLSERNPCVSVGVDVLKDLSLAEWISISIECCQLQDKYHNDSFLDHGYGSGPFSNKSNYFFKTPGATFFSNSSGWRSLNRHKYCIYMYM